MNEYTKEALTLDLHDFCTRSQIDITPADTFTMAAELWARFGATITGLGDVPERDFDEALTRNRR